MIQTIGDYFQVAPQKLETSGVHNAFIGIDSRLFVDPHLLRDCDILEFENSYKTLGEYFGKIIRLLKVSRIEGDTPWRSATSRLHFPELSGAAIGYGSETESGRGIGRVLANRLTRTAREIISLGVEDPEIFELLGLFEKGIGADLLSDMTVWILRQDFWAYTTRVARELGITHLKPIRVGSVEYQLPFVSGQNSRTLLPKKILRTLPVAQSWEDIGTVVLVNEELRRRYNALVARIFGDTTRGRRRKPPKPEIRNYLMSNPEELAVLVKSYKASQALPYDFSRDPDGEVSWHKIAKEFSQRIPFAIENKPETIDDLIQFVRKMISQFQRNVEANGLNILLYKDNQKNPRHERFAQLVFFGIADTLCSEYDVSVSREPNAGSGAVDFTFATGYKSKVTVEIKLTSNAHLVHGFSTQLPVYQRSENSAKSFFVVIRVTEPTKTIERLKSITAQAIDRGESTPEIIIIDARIMPSASRR